MDYISLNECLFRLGLDILRPLYTPLGLVINDKESFQNILKKHLEPNLTMQGDYPWLKEKVIKDILFDLRENLSSMDYTNFICFADTIFENKSETYSKWNNWKNAFFEAINNKDAIFDKDTIIILNNLKTLNANFSPFSNELETLYEAIAGNKITTWDKKLFYYAKFYLTEENDPFLIIDFSISMNRFQLFWEKYILPLPEFQLVKLYTVCNQINLSKSTSERESHYKDDNGKLWKFIVPGIKFETLLFPSEMRRCVKE